MSDETGFRKCGQKDCEFPATHWLVWTEPQYCCLIHAQSLLNVADAIGFPTPAATLRKLAPAEMFVDDEDENGGQHER